MRQSLYEYCVTHKRESLLHEWDAEKNDGLTPKDVKMGGHYKAWWRCARGHIWQASVYTRKGGSGCPYCAGRSVWRGENDLASQRPDLAAQWHPVKNGDLTPEQVTIGSHRKVWWVCGKGHEWQSDVRTRVNGAGCPYCANRAILHGENDLYTTHPDLCREWNFEKNNGLTPAVLTAGSHKKVWWRCGQGHEWQAAVVSRAQGTGCPVCAGRVSRKRLERYACVLNQNYAEYDKIKSNY